MIVVHINPAGVEKVFFQADNDLAEDMCLAVWPLVRQELDRLHKKLRRTTKTTLKLVESSQKHPPEAA